VQPDERFEAPRGATVQVSGGCGLFWLLLAAFVLVPLVELALLLELHGALGLLPTLGLVLLTGALGAAMTRRQGLATLAHIRSELSRGVLPGQSLLEGALILAAGALLLTPGVLTDALGFCLLVPATRRALGRALRAWARDRLTVRGGQDPGVIDAEVLRSGPVDPPAPAALGEEDRPQDPSACAPGADDV